MDNSNTEATVGIVGILLAGVVILLGVALLAWWVVGLVELLKTPDSQWARADQNKIVYLVLMLVLGVFGTVLYYLVARPSVRRAAAAP